MENGTEARPSKGPIVIPSPVATTATVYSIEGRRFLTARAAYRKLAMRAVYARHVAEWVSDEPEDYSPPAPGFEAYVERLTGRLARWLAWRDRRVNEEASGPRLAAENDARAFYASLTIADPSRWEIVRKPIFGRAYDFADLETKKYGQCWMKQDGSGWGQAPLGKSPVILKWRGPK